MSGPMAKWCGWHEPAGEEPDFERLRTILLCAVNRGCGQSDPCSERARDIILHAARRPCDKPVG